VAVILDEGSRETCGRIGDLMFQSSEGARVHLASTADSDCSFGQYNIPHTAQGRRQTVGCDVQGRDLASFVAEVRGSDRRRRFTCLRHYITWSASFASSGGGADARFDVVAGEARESSCCSPLFSNLRNMLLVLANLHSALVGRRGSAVSLTGNILSLGSLVGSVTCSASRCGFDHDDFAFELWCA